MKNLHRTDVKQLILMLGSTLIFGSVLLVKAFYFVDNITKYALLFISIAGPITLYALILLYNRFKWKLIGIILLNILIMIGYFKGISAMLYTTESNPTEIVNQFVLFGVVMIHFLVFIYFVWFHKRKKQRLKDTKENLTDFPLVKAVIPKGTALLYITLFFLFTLNLVLRR